MSLINVIPNECTAIFYDGSNAKEVTEAMPEQFIEKDGKLGHKLLSDTSRDVFWEDKELGWKVSIFGEVTTWSNEAFRLNFKEQDKTEEQL